MSRKAILSVMAVVLLGITTSIPGPAHGGGRHHHRSQVHFGVFVGAPAYYPHPYYYYPLPYYYYPPAVVTQPSPPVYIERSDTHPSPERPQDYWYYYCPEAKAYYPYVKQCAAGWQRVSPQPPG